MHKLIGAGAGAAGQLLIIYYFSPMGLTVGNDAMALALTNIGGQLIVGNVLEVLAKQAGLGY